MQAPLQTAPTEPSHPSFLRLPVVRRRTGLGRSTIYRMMSKKQFPEPVRIGLRAIAWREADIDDWMNSRPRTH
ncbi:AlpA family transcriptional regulator [Roseateles sp.]|uniref:helix-turn-helix transcriptional regulator n=1 Tax=Roseateles sp. TaxID=1971397 RepID=UPI0032659611